MYGSFETPCLFCCDSWNLKNYLMNAIWKMFIHTSYIVHKGISVLKHRVYSHLSNKREVMLTDFEKKNPPSMHISTLHVYWFLRFFPTSTPRLLQLGTIFFQKIHVYSNLHVYWFCNFCLPYTFIPTSSAIIEIVCY